ncbi:hypothetical protein Xekk_04479 [Xenorhabdus sp. KK7.4]|nr:hypothetical protein Xekk_04479 [Xenorhabdus sp. KK7.4]
MQAALRTHTNPQPHLINRIGSVGGFRLGLVLQRQSGGHTEVTVTEKQRFILKPEADAFFRCQAAEKRIIGFTFLGHIFPVLMRIVELRIGLYPVFFQQAG